MPLLLMHVLPAINPPQLVLEQLSRPDERRCPIAKASNEVVELLAEHWAIFAPGCTRLQMPMGVHCILNYDIRFDIYDLSTILPRLP
jgi:hypothetical protein